MSVKHLLVVIMGMASLAGLPVGVASAQEPEKTTVGHVVYGKMVFENENPAAPEDDYEATIFGVDVQKSFNRAIVAYGLETGALFSVDSELRQVTAASGGGGGTVRVTVDIRSILMDFFAGGYVALEPTRWLRLHAGAGPLLIGGIRETEPTEPDAAPLDEESEFKIGVGVYARAGIDLLFTDYLGFNAGARFTETTLRFEGPAGRRDVQGWQYYAGLAFRF